MKRIVVLLSAVLSMQVFAQEHPIGMDLGDTIGSMEQAERLLVQVKTQRASIDATFAQRQQQCHTRFFVTACVDHAKEQQRQGQAQLRVAEINANLFKRRFLANEHDAMLAKKRAKLESDGERPSKENLEN